VQCDWLGSLEPCLLSSRGQRLQEKVIRKFEKEVTIATWFARLFSGCVQVEEIET
jgi:hypothetical protein